MKEKKKKSAGVAAYYDAQAKDYSVQYQTSTLTDLSREYPANYFRLQMLLNSFVDKNIKKVVEIGVGEGTPLSTLAKAGIDVWGCDIAEKMVKRSKETMRKNGLNPNHISWADIQDATTYAALLKAGPFDGLMAMGVMPHVEKEELVLQNMASLVRPGGSVFIEFRNKLFSLFTFNRYTADFILNDLLQGVDDRLKSLVAKELESRLRMDLPPVRKVVEGTTAPGFDAILSKFHNPFEVVEMFKKYKFEDIQLRWYHYHPAPPLLAKSAPELFRKEAVRLEHETSNWRGMFLCSAFVVEARKSAA